MVNNSKKFWTISEIDATGVRGPHEIELKNISNAKYHHFINIDQEKLLKIVNEDLGAKIENLSLHEDWTITIEMFPEVIIHLLYSYFGDEFGDIEAEFKFLFSGEHANMVTGEDSATFIDIIIDFLERKIKGEEPFEKNYEKKSELMEKVLIQRANPFSLLVEKDLEKLAEFIGAKVWKVKDGWKIKRQIFPKIYIEITWDYQNGLDISFFGDNLSKNISSYHGELIGIFTINHILRYITIQNEEKELPDICYMMFSRHYTKVKNWTHRTR
ncbi:MAG: hypothetical protein ACFFAF_13535 [Candidatus Hermodarchaeota archaeon]